MTRATLITGARVLDPMGELHQPPALDLLVEDGVIAAIGSEAAARGRDAAIFVADGLLVTPGFVNAHCHSHDTLLRGLFEQLPLELWGHVAFPFHWPPRSTEEVAVRTRLHAAECLLAGITTLQDMVTIVGADLEHAAAISESYEASGIEAIVAPQFSDLAGAAGVPFVSQAFSPRLQASLGSNQDPDEALAGVLRMIDRTPSPRVTWALGPVQPQICSDALLEATAASAAERGLRLYTHLYETRAEACLARTTLPADDGSLVRRLERLGVAGESLTVAHAVWIAPAEIGRLAMTGVSFATNPVTNLKLMNGVAPIVRFRKAGASVGVGSDNSSASDVQSPFQGMKLFALAWAMQEATNEGAASCEAFRAATIGGAAAVGLAGRVGRIAPGFRADLNFIDLADPSWLPLNSAVRQLVYGETGRGLRHVMCGGAMVVRDRRLTTMDQSALARDAARVRIALQPDLDRLLRLDPELVAAYRAVADRVDAYPLPMDARLLRA